MRKDIPRHAVAFLITAYQHTLSPDSGLLRYAGFSKGGICRFHPTCSEYTKNAVLSHGLAKGLLLGTRQISQCHPWHKKEILNPNI